MQQEAWKWAKEKGRLMHKVRKTRLLYLIQCSAWKKCMTDAFQWPGWVRVGIWVEGGVLYLVSPAANMEARIWMEFGLFGRCRKTPVGEWRNKTGKEWQPIMGDYPAGTFMGDWNTAPPGNTKRQCKKLAFRRRDGSWSADTPVPISERGC